MTKKYDKATLRAIYEILIRTCGAYDAADAFTQFIYAADRFAAGWSFEYRFQGSLGFGGKVWLYNGDYPYVNCYREDQTPERKKAIAQADQALRELIQKGT